MKKFKIKVKGWLLVKIARYRKEIKAYKEKITENVIKEQAMNDKITLLENDIRQLTLMLPQEQRKKWLEDQNKKGVRK